MVKLTPARHLRRGILSFKRVVLVENFHFFSSNVPFDW